MKWIFAAVAAGALAIPACAKRAEAPPFDHSAEINAIADEYLAAYLDFSPFSVIYAGLGDVVDEDLAAIEDNSPAGLARLQAVENRLIERLERVDAGALAARADIALYDTLKEALLANAEQRVCRLNLWRVNHMLGWQSAFALVAAAQPVDTPVKRAMALARWRQLPRYLEQEKRNLAAGLAAGYSAPRSVVARVIAQLDAIVAAPPGKSPFLSFAADAPGDKAFAEAIDTLAKNEIAPAVVAFRDFLRDEYMPKAREARAIRALPNGEQCYEALLRFYHTADIGAKSTFERGMAAVESNRSEVVQRGEAMFGIADFAAILERVRMDPANRFRSEQELIEFTRSLGPIARERIAPFFRTLPEQGLLIEPYADYLKGTGQSSRYEPKPAGEGPAIYRINTDEWTTHTKGEAEVVLVHEGWPGHHLQIATAYSIEGLHPIMRLFGSSAYVEGWARYSEQLAEEAGLYASGFGAISRRAWPARGMVVDPGLHLYGWTDEEAKAFLIESGRFDDESAEAALDRIAIIPGQLTAYDTGGLEILALRAKAFQRLGERFDIQAFHDRVLENGAIPLGALRAHVESWIAEEEAKAK